MASLLTGAVTMAWSDPERACSPAALRYATARSPESRLRLPNSMPDTSVPRSRINSTGSSLTSEGPPIHRCFSPGAKSKRFGSKTERSVNSIHRANGRVVEIDLRTTSRPIPAGSPVVIPIVGRMKEDAELRSVDVLVLVFLVHVLDVVL